MCYRNAYEILFDLVVLQGSTTMAVAICRRRLLQVALLLMRRKSKSKRKYWMRPLFQERLAGREFNLYDELRSKDREYFFRYFRMNPERLDALFGLRANCKKNILLFVRLCRLGRDLQ